MFYTEYKFTLPKGLVDSTGAIHRHGVMRLAIGKDEVSVQNDHRVQENSAYYILLILSRLITHLGSLSSVTPELLEQLFLSDLVYLREFYYSLHQPNLELSASGEF